MSENENRLERLLGDHNPDEITRRREGTYTSAVIYPMRRIIHFDEVMAFIPANRIYPLTHVPQPLPAPRAFD